MMWPSLNFLLYNENIMQIIKKKRNYYGNLPRFCDVSTMYKLLQIQLKKKKQLMILMPAKHDHTCRKEIYLLLSSRFLLTK